MYQTPCYHAPRQPPAADMLCLSLENQGVGRPLDLTYFQLTGHSGPGAFQLLPSGTGKLTVKLSAVISRLHSKSKDQKVNCTSTYQKGGRDTCL